MLGREGRSVVGGAGGFGFASVSGLGKSATIWDEGQIWATRLGVGKYLV